MYFFYLLLILFVVQTDDYSAYLANLKTRYKVADDEYVIIVDVSIQKLFLLKPAGTVFKSYPVSTSKFGTGNKAGSNKTPLGTHRIFQKIGDKAEQGSIFKSRVNTQQLATIYKEEIDIPQDYVTTRIMWLKGLEAGVNKGKGLDSYARCIYIHGTPEEGLLGKTASHGCVRMSNKDVIELFNLVKESTLVEIVN